MIPTAKDDKVKAGPKSVPAPREAFEAWCKDTPPPYSRRGEMAEAWKAACSWQREKDAKICEDQIDEQSSTGWNGCAEMCMYAIRSQND